MSLTTNEVVFGPYFCSWGGLFAGASLEKTLSIAANAGFIGAEYGAFGDHGDFESLVEGDGLERVIELFQRFGLSCPRIAVEVPTTVPVWESLSYEELEHNTRKLCQTLNRWSNGPRRVRLDWRAFPTDIEEPVVAEVSELPRGDLPGRKKEGHQATLSRCRAAIAAQVEVLFQEGFEGDHEVETGFYDNRWQESLDQIRSIGHRLLLDYAHARTCAVDCARQIEGFTADPLTFDQAIDASEGLLGGGLHICWNPGAQDLHYLEHLGGGLITARHFRPSLFRSEVLETTGRIAKRRDAQDVEWIAIDPCGDPDCLTHADESFRVTKAACELFT